MRDYFHRESPVRFVWPIDGDVLNSADGVEAGDAIRIAALVESPEAVTVNGVPAAKRGRFYRAEADIPKNGGTLIAESAAGRDVIEVLRLPRHQGYFRYSSDDNIVFLYNINKNRDVYDSIFCDPYLSVYKKAHDLYGACFHLNVYYSMPAKDVYFSEERGYFDLSMMTDRFRAEWEANSDWLRLNFHARADHPPRPYGLSSYETVYTDCERVRKEIVRFAGEKTLSRETTVHYGSCSEDGVRALRDLGIECLAGYFVLENGKPHVSYFYPKDMVTHIGGRDFWYDRELDVLYAKIDRVANLHTPDETVSLLDAMEPDGRRSGFIELMIHEEYFYPDSKYYLSDFEDRVLLPCKWARDRGYKGSFLADLR